MFNSYCGQAVYLFSIFPSPNSELLSTQIGQIHFCVICGETTDLTHLISFALNSPTRSICSNSGTISSIANCTSSAILKSDSLPHFHSKIVNTTKTQIPENLERNGKA